MDTPTTILDRRYSDPDVTPTSWDETRRLLETAEPVWLTTVRADGRPHTTPVVAVWLDGALHFTTGWDEQKGANLRQNPQVIALTGRNDWDGGIDVVLEGTATVAAAPALLARLATAWRRRWDGRWTFEARDGRFFHHGGEVIVYSVRPDKVLASAKGPFGHTTHRFPGAVS